MVKNNIESPLILTLRRHDAIVATARYRDVRHYLFRIERKIYEVFWHQTVLAYRDHTGRYRRTQRIDDALSRPEERATCWRVDDEDSYIRGISTTSKDARDKRAPCREKHSITVVPHASICRYLFNFSIGKHRHAANAFSAIWLRRLCHVKAPQYRRDRLSSSSLLSQTMPFSLLRRVVAAYKWFAYRSTARFLIKFIQAKNFILLLNLDNLLDNFYNFEEI